VHGLWAYCWTGRKVMVSPLQSGAPIRNADRIAVVTERGIAEQGRHRDLVASGGVYSRPHAVQFGA
jgi:hypothetical protein